MEVYFEGTKEGMGGDDDRNGLDEVATEMVAMELTAKSPLAGIFRLRQHAALPSTGQIEENANTKTGRLDVQPFASSGTASSFFNMYFEIELDGVTYYTIDPTVLSSEITHKPPRSGEVYTSAGAVDLIDKSGRPSGMSLGIAGFVPSPCIRCSDFDEKDGANIADLSELADNWLWRASGLDRYNAADLDCSGAVNMSDLATFALHWMIPCPG